MPLPPVNRRLAFAIAAAAMAAALLAFIVIAKTPSSIAANPNTPSSIAAAPADLAVPSGLSGDDLHAWCVSRLAQGTTRLSANAVNWLDACAEASSPTPSSTGSTATAAPTPTVVPTPSASSKSPTPTQPPVTPTTSPTTPTPTAVPTSPTPGSSAPTACLPNPSACGYPDGSNTGVPAGTVLTPSSGDFTVRNDGAVIDGMDIDGCITIAASNVVIRDSRISCPGPYGIHLDDRIAATNLLIEDTEVDCENTQATGIAGHNLAAVRVNVHGCENGLAMDDNTSLTDSWIHDLFTGPGGHSDGIQSGGQHVLIQHNTISNLSPGGTSAVITDPSSTADFTVSGNILDGGGYPLYCPKTAANGFTVTGNRFADKGFAYSTNCANPWVMWSDNVEDSTGAALAAA